MKKKKICFLVPKVYSLFNPHIKSTFGGAERQVYYIGSQLAKENGFDIHYIVADLGQQDYFEQPKKNLSLHKAFSFNENRIKALKRLIRISKEIDADIYVFRAASLKTALTFFLMRNLFKKKTLYMVAHDQETSTRSLANKTDILTALAMQPVYSQTDILAVQSHYQYKHYAPKRKKETVLINKMEDLSGPLPDMNKKSTILWVGRSMKWKRPEVFFTLATRYTKEHFVMIMTQATDNNSYWKSLKQQAQEIKNLTFHEYIEPQKIEEYYNQAKIFVITSTNETFSHAMMEAARSQTPLLSLNVNTDNIITNDKFGFCAHDNLHQFYSDFELLLRNKKLREDMGARARAYLEKHHSPEVCIKELKKVLS